MTDERKVFASLAARFALVGHSLIRANQSEGKAPYIVSRWGWIRPIHSIEEATTFLKQLEGRTR